MSRDDASRDHNNTHGAPDLSAAESADILASGMALMAVQHVQRPGWTPSQTLGAAYGANAARYALEAGLPPGVSVWLDLEGVKPGATSASVIAYGNAWFAAVAGAGFVPGVYVGFDCGLTSDELFFDLTTRHYWKAGGDIPPVSHRGYQLIQNIQHPGTPQEFDRDVTQTDALGGAARWLAPA